MNIIPTKSLRQSPKGDVCLTIKTKRKGGWRGEVVALGWGEDEAGFPFVRVSTDSDLNG